MEKKQILKEFDRHGYSLRPQSYMKIKEFLLEGNLFESEHNCKLLISKIKQITQSNIIEEQVAEDAINMVKLPTVVQETQIQIQQLQHSNQSELSKILNNKINNSIIILDIFKEVPKLEVNNNKIELQQNEKSIFGSAEDKINVFRTRYQLIKYKLSRCSNYRFDNQTSYLQDNNLIPITEIGSLILNKDKLCYIMGMIVESFDKQYYMQDEYSTTKLDITKAVIQQGYITDNCIVVAVGVYSELYERFVVKQFFLPEINHKKQLQNLDCSGFLTKAQNLLANLIQKQLNQEEKFSKLERQTQISLGYIDLNTNDYFQNIKTSEMSVVAISDFLLEDNNVLHMFEQFLSSVEKKVIDQPLAFILMGQFFSINKVGSEQDMLRIKQNLNNFLAVLEKYPIIKNNSYFFFLPHVNDIGINVYPKPPLVAQIFEELEKKIPYLIRVSNPARLSILGKEFIISRNDISKELRKHTIVKNEDQQTDQQLAYTILSQGHILPINFYHAPIFWNYDHTLQFFDQPQFLILADQNCNQFSIKSQEEQEEQGDGTDEKNVNDGIILINPGSFKKKGQFTIIYPQRMEAFDKAI